MVSKVTIIILLIVVSLQGCMAQQIQKVTEEINQRREAYIATHPKADAQTKQAVLNGKIFIGMEKDAVIASYGKPYKINRTVTAMTVTEQWIYGFESFDGSFISGPILYIENGHLTAWQN